MKTISVCAGFSGVVRGLVLSAVCVLGAVLSMAGTDPSPSPREVVMARQALISRFQDEGVDAMPALIDALESEIGLLRRTAAHLLVRLGPPGIDGLAVALRHSDFQVRRIAMHGLDAMGRLRDFWPMIVRDPHPSLAREIRLRFFPQLMSTDPEHGDAVIEAVADAYLEAEAPVRFHLVSMVADLPVLPRSGRRFLTRATRDDDPDIQAVAFTVVVLPAMTQLRALTEAGDWKALIAEFGDEDFNEWPATPKQTVGTAEHASEAAEAAVLRGRAYFEVGQGEAARDDFRFALNRDGETGRYAAAVWTRLGRNAEQHLKDSRQAIEAYVGAFNAAGTAARGLSPLLRAIDMLRDEGAYREALELLERVDLGGLVRRRSAFQQVLSRRVAVLEALDREADAQALRDAHPLPDDA